VCSESSPDLGADSAHGLLQLGYARYATAYDASYASDDSTISGCLYSCCEYGCLQPPPFHLYGHVPGAECLHGAIDPRSAPAYVFLPQDPVVRWFPGCGSSVIFGSLELFGLVARFDGLGCVYLVFSLFAVVISLLQRLGHRWLRSCSLGRLGDVALPKQLTHGVTEDFGYCLSNRREFSGRCLRLSRVSKFHDIFRPRPVQLHPGLQPERSCSKSLRTFRCDPRTAPVPETWTDWFRRLIASKPCASPDQPRSLWRLFRLPDGQLPHSFMSHVNSIAPIRTSPVSGPAGMKRACCGSEARKVALNPSLRVAEYLN
jgi:hypothetical protein